MVTPVLSTRTQMNELVGFLAPGDAPSRWWFFWWGLTPSGTYQSHGMVNHTFAEAWHEDTFGNWKRDAPLGTRWFRMRYWSPERATPSGWKWDQTDLYSEYLSEQQMLTDRWRASMATRW